MTSVEELQRQLEVDEALERANALDWIKVIHDIDEQFKPLERARAQARAALKQWMELHRDTLDHDEKDYPLLHHPDLNETWVLQGSTTNGYDLVSAAESDPDVVINAAKNGWLKADHEAVTKHPGASWVERLKRFHMPAAGSESLTKKGR